ncbi:MAG TPA: alpha/beta hydrolase [bacterium]|jgi:pimeloyl-ACP methyl ester carboxylesterase|nr:alpha/beta hydrolase [bacterium]
MKSYKNLISVLTLFFGTILFFPNLLWADSVNSLIPVEDKPLHVQVLDNGSINLLENMKQVMYITPLIYCSQDWQGYNGRCWIDVSGKAPDLQVKASLPNNVSAALKTSIEVLKSGIHIRYTLIPSGPAKVLRVAAQLDFLYDDWAGDPYQLGPTPMTLPGIQPLDEEIDLAHSDGPLSLGPSPTFGNLTVKLNTQGLHATVYSSKWRKRFYVTLSHDEPPEKTWEWNAGEEKVFDFTVAFNRNLVQEPADDEPKRPFHYREEEVTFTNQQAGVTLAGTLTLPRQGGPFPAVLLINGSGEPNRDGYIWPHNFLVLSDYLTRHGFAVLRYDKRGVGSSSGDFDKATLGDFADDARAGFEYLKNRKEVNPLKVGLIGHSEGSYCAPLVASRSKDVAFIVLTGGIGVGGKSQDFSEWSRCWNAERRSDEFIVFNTRIYKRIMDEVAGSRNEDEAKSKINKFIREEMAEKYDSKELIKFQSAVPKWAEYPYPFPYYKYFEKYDPRAALEQVTCPVLAVSGEKDLWAPPDVNLPAIEKALKEGKNPEFTSKIFPGLSHILQNTITGDPEEWFDDLPKPFAPGVLGYITDWIEKHTK